MKNLLTFLIFLVSILICHKIIQSGFFRKENYTTEIPLRRLYPRIDKHFEGIEPIKKPTKDLIVVGMLCDPSPDGSIPAIEASFSLIKEDLKSGSRRLLILLVVSSDSVSNLNALTDHVTEKLKIYIDDGYIKVIKIPQALYSNSPKNYLFSQMSLGHSIPLLERIRRINLRVAYMMNYAFIHGLNFIFYDDSLSPHPGAINTIIEKSKNVKPNVLSMDFGVDFYGRWYSIKHIQNVIWYLYNLPYFTDLKQALFLYHFSSFSTESQKSDVIFTQNTPQWSTNFETVVKSNMTMHSPELVSSPKRYSTPFRMKYPKEGETIEFLLAKPQILLSVKVVTGVDKFLVDALSSGKLEASYDEDCKVYNILSTFETGDAYYKWNYGHIVYCLRIKINQQQTSWTAIRYIHIM